MRLYHAINYMSKFPIDTSELPSEVFLFLRKLHIIQKLIFYKISGRVRPTII